MTRTSRRLRRLEIKESKLGAVRLVVEQGYTQAEAADRLGVSAWSIRRWIEQFLLVSLLAFGELQVRCRQPGVDRAADLFDRQGAWLLDAPIVVLL